MLRSTLLPRVRLLVDPPLWSWELVDAASGRVVVSSWVESWEAYGSRDEAFAAAVRILRDLGESTAA